MKTISTRELNRRTAQILDEVETGATFELLRNGKAIGYLTPTPPALEGTPDWGGHFEWLKKQRTKGGGFVQELEAERRRGRARDQAMGEPS